MKLLSTVLMSLAFAASAFAGVDQRTPLPVEVPQQQSLRTFPNLQAGDRVDNPLHKAPQVITDGMHIECTTLWGADYSPKFHDWYLGIQDNTYRIYLDLINPSVEGQFEGGYTTGDCDMWGTYIVSLNGAERYDFSELNVITTGDPDGYCEITGEGVLKDGKEVTFHYANLPAIDPDEEVILSGATIDVFELSSATYGGKSHLAATSDDGTLQIDIVWDGIIGDFDTSKLDVVYTKVTDLTTGKSTKLDNGYLSVDINVAYQLYVYAELTCKDAVCYVFEAEKQLELGEPVSIEAHNLFTTSYQDLVWLFDGSTPEYPVIEAQLFCEPYTGEVTDYMGFFLTDAEGDEVWSLTTLYASLSLDADGRYVVDGEFVGENFVPYTVHLDFVLSEPTENRTFFSSKLELADYTAQIGGFQIYGYSADENEWISFVFDASKVTPGRYDQLSEDNKAYCYIVTDANGRQTMNLMLTCDIELGMDGREFTVDGVCQTGEILWLIEASGVLAGDDYDDKENDLDLTFTASEITQNEIWTSYGLAAVSAQNAERHDQLALYFVVDGNELPAGVYPINHTEQPGTAVAGEVQGYDIYPSVYFTMTDRGELASLWILDSGTITVSYDAEGLLSLTIDAHNTWGRTAHIVVNGPDTGIQSLDAGQAQQHGKFFDGNSIVIRSHGRQYNAYGQQQ